MITPLSSLLCSYYSSLHIHERSFQYMFSHRNGSLVRWGINRASHTCRFVRYEVILLSKLSNELMIREIINLFYPLHSMCSQKMYSCKKQHKYISCEEITCFRTAARQINYISHARWGEEGHNIKPVWRVA